MSRYIGLDVHKASTTMVVVGASGKKLASHIVHTSASALISLLQAIRRPRYLVFEEGTQSSWLYEQLSPHVDDLVVVAAKKRPQDRIKSDFHDALELANDLRINAIKTRVFKDTGRFGLLREFARVYRMQVQDSVRVSNRIQALYRSCCQPSQMQQLVDQQTRRAQIRQLPAKLQQGAELLLRQYDSIQELRAEAHKLMLQEARKHPEVKLLRTIPGMGPKRAPQLMAIIVSPHRFRTKRQLWKYSGLAVVTTVSAQWIPDKHGGWRQAKAPLPRGLNPNHNPVLKDIFKGAASNVVARAQSSNPLYRHYVSMTEQRTKPNLAKLTIARQIAAISLAVLKNKEEFDPKKVGKTL